MTLMWAMACGSERGVSGLSCIVEIINLREGFEGRSVATVSLYFTFLEMSN